MGLLFSVLCFCALSGDVSFSFLVIPSLDLNESFFYRKHNSSLSSISFSHTYIKILQLIMGDQ